MATSTTKPNKLDALLRAPPKENLNSHFILGGIIDHIGLIADDFPHVKVPLLKSHLWDIRNKYVDPETHLRGFLKVFEETPVFKEAFAQLDDGVKTQLNTFIAGGDEKVVMAARGKGNAFHLPPSPPVKHHFREIEEKIRKLESKVTGLFHHQHTNSVDSATNGVTNRHVEKAVVAEKDFPLMNEDEAETKTMEVSTKLFFTKVVPGRQIREKPMSIVSGNIVILLRLGSLYPTSS